MLLFAMANCGLPGTSGFVGEFLVILCSFKASVWYALIAATALILGASYNLWMYKRVIFGPVEKQSIALLEDVHLGEAFVLAVLAVCVLCLGLWPEPLFVTADASLQHLLEQILLTRG